MLRRRQGMWEMGLSMANLSALYSESTGDALSGSRQFQADVYLMEHWLQVWKAWSIVMNSGDNGGKVPNSGFVRSCRGFTSVQSALSSLSAVQGKVRYHNSVSASLKDFLCERVTALPPLSGITGSGSRPGTSSVSIKCLRSPMLMAPRQRGVPRRGGVWGIRRRQEAQARAIPPLAIVAPPSSPSEESDPSESQVHTSRFTFRCRRNQSLVSFMITVIATEEEEETVSQEEDDGEQVQTRNAQAIAEVGNAEDPPPDDINPVAPVVGLVTHPQPVHPPEIRLEDIGDATMFDWLPLPPEVDNNAQGEPPKA